MAMLRPSINRTLASAVVLDRCGGGCRRSGSCSLISAVLAVFSWKIPDWMVQIPAASSRR